ncbi:MAG: hypothetical protein ACD_34C00588G0001, partial [uncultured bacterium]
MKNTKVVLAFVLALCLVILSACAGSKPASGCLG